MDIDIDIGARGEPMEPVRRAFELRGVTLDGRTIRGLRAGTRNPVGIAYRLATVDKLRGNDASLKTELLLHVIQLGRALRRPGRAPRVFGNVGLTRAMAAELGWTAWNLSMIMRIMRADLALWSMSTWDDDLMTRFRATAEKYLRTHRERDWRVLRSRNDYVNAAWDKQTIHGFYFALYSLGGFQIRAGWLPYELDVLLRFYSGQKERGTPLTPLDRQVLAGAANHEPPSVLSRMVNAHVKVDYTATCVGLHRRLLVTGSCRPVVRFHKGRPGAGGPSAEC